MTPLGQKMGSAFSYEVEARSSAPVRLRKPQPRIPLASAQMRSTTAMCLILILKFQRLRIRQARSAVLIGRQIPEKLKDTVDSRIAKRAKLNITVV